jgi:glycosyltransferase involved in cell wall biosynthesis
VSSPGQPEVAVCVSTRNRAAHLDLLLHALTRQTVGVAQFEVVVTDDGSTDGTRDVLDRHVAAGRLQLAVRRHESSRGAAAGRNLAWRSARAGVCAFTDDDCAPTPDWLEHGLRAMRTTGFVVGAVEPREEDRERIGAFSRFLRVTAGEAAWTPTANLFVRRADLEQVGGFDERFRVAEDVDLGLRLQKAGTTYRFEPGVLVHHAVNQPSWRALVREQQRWVDLPLVIATHRDRRAALLVGGIFWKPTHARVLLAGMAVAALAARRPRLATVLLLPWLHERGCTNPVGGDDKRERVTTMPGTFAVDASETLALMRGSWKHRTLVL